MAADQYQDDNGVWQPFDPAQLDWNAQPDAAGMFFKPAPGPNGAAWDGQSQGNLDASTAAGQPVDLPVNAPAPAGSTGQPLPWDKAARNSIRDAWQSGTGSLEDFVKNNPLAQQYQSQLRVSGDHLYLNPTIDDKYASMGPEDIDAVLDYGPGGANTHVWTGAGPGSNDGSAAPGAVSAVDPSGSQGWAPDDALSQLINSKYMDLINGGGTSDFGKTLQDSLSAILKNGGKASPMSAAEFESIRQPIEKGRRAQTNQAMAELADRGLLGEGGGHQQGPESTALDRIESTIAPEWATTLQQASTEHDKLTQGLFSTALSTGEQEANRENQSVLGALQGASGRQNDISQIALENLNQNRMWQQFVSQFGLDQQKVSADIQNGNIQNLIPLLQLFSQNAGTASGGFI